MTRPEDEGDSMGCVVCNPYCGKCRPPQPKPVRCTACGKLVARTRDQKWTCPHCGVALPPRQKIRCNWSGRLCDIPCMFNIIDNPTGELHPCRWPRRGTQPAAADALKGDAAVPNPPC